jgi:hypothetical protein
MSGYEDWMSRSGVKQDMSLNRRIRLLGHAVFGLVRKNRYWALSMGEIMSTTM